MLDSVFLTVRPNNLLWDKTATLLCWVLVDLLQTRQVASFAKMILTKTRKFALNLVILMPLELAVKALKEDPTTHVLVPTRTPPSAS